MSRLDELIDREKRRRKDDDAELEDILQEQYEEEAMEEYDEDYG